MIGRRSPAAAAAIQASADDLPFEDKSFDASMAQRTLFEPPQQRLAPHRSGAEERAGGHCSKSLRVPGHEHIARVLALRIGRERQAVRQESRHVLGGMHRHIDAAGKGILRLYADHDGTVIGATIVGPDAEHPAHMVALGLACGLTLHELADQAYYHPTVMEVLQNAARDALSALAKSDA